MPPLASPGASATQSRTVRLAPGGLGDVRETPPQCIYSEHRHPLAHLADPTGLLLLSEAWTSGSRH